MLTNLSENIRKGCWQFMCLTFVLLLQNATKSKQDKTSVGIEKQLTMLNGLPLSLNTN